MKSLYFLPFAIFLFFVSSADAQILYTDLDPDIQISQWNMYGFHFYKTDSTLSYGSTGAFYVWKHPTEVVLNSLDNNCEVMCSPGSVVPKALDKDEIIGENSENWLKPDYYIMNNSGTKGNWIGVTDKYLGLRFKENDSWYYGWARLDVDGGPTYFRLKDYAYNTEGNSILAGQTEVTPVEDETDPGINVYTTGGGISIEIPQKGIFNASVSVYGLLGDCMYHNDNVGGFLHINNIDSRYCFVIIKYNGRVLIRKVML